MTSNPMRYTQWCAGTHRHQLMKNPDGGEWVSWEDYSKLQLLVESLQRELGTVSKLGHRLMMQQVETSARIAVDGDVMPWGWRPRPICRAAPFRNADPPQDCDAPFCGCVPAWDDAIAMLQESGWKSPEELRQARASVFDMAHEVIKELHRQDMKGMRSECDGAFLRIAPLNEERPAQSSPEEPT